MLEGLVTWVLNNYLGKYVENLNTDQLSIALLSGEVELENLPLRREALRHLGLPIEVRAGFLGKVRLQVPVRQIRSAPWVIQIDQLYLVITPVNLAQWDSDAEECLSQEYKMGLLDSLEAQWRAENEVNPDCGYYATSISSWMSYGTSLITNIIENLQLKINDVHIRYEDAITCGDGNSFSCGLIMDSFCAESCDSNWLKSFTTILSSQSGGCSFKLLELDKMAFYWDHMNVEESLADLSLADLAVKMSNAESKPHQFIMNPVSAFAKLRRERTELPLRSHTRPRLTCQLELENVDLMLNNKQYNQIMGCEKGLSLISRLRVFRQWRPSIPLQQDARAWWVYAVKCYIPEATFMGDRPTWKACLERSRSCLQYVNLYATQLSNPTWTPSAQDKLFKEHFEWMSSFQQLKLLRESAMRSTPNRSRRNMEKSVATSSDVQGRSLLMRWFPQWWGWYGGQEGIGGATDPEEPPSLEGEILDVLADSIENNTVLRRDAVFGRFKFNLSKGSLQLCEAQADSASPDRAKLELQFENVGFSIESRPRTSSHSLSVALGSLHLKDYCTENTLFPVLIAPQGTIREGLGGGTKLSAQTSISTWAKNSLVSGSNIGASSPPPSSPSEPLFQLVYERKPLGVAADYKLFMKCQSLEIVYNPGAVKWLLEFLSRPLEKDVGTYAHVKHTTKMHLINQWEHILKGNLNERSVWQLELDISAPQILLIEKFTDRNGVMVLIDFGTMHLTNGFQSIQNTSTAAQETITEEDDNEMFMTPCSTPPGSEASDVNLTECGASPLPADPPLTFPAVTSGVGQSTAALDQDALHHRLYDRYKVELSDLQVLVGRVRDNWKYANTKGTSSLHILDRFNISLQLERRVIYTSDPQFPSVTLCGTLPNLVVHLNEHKLLSIQALVLELNHHQIQIPPSNSFSSLPLSDDLKISPPQEDVTVDLSETEHTDRSYNHLSRLLMLQFHVDQMALEVQSRGRSIAEVQVCGVRASFTKRPYDYSLSLSVHSLLLVDALQTYGPDFELLIASHKHVGMDSVSGSMRDSEPTSPTSPVSPPPTAHPPPAAALSQALHHLNTSSSFMKRQQTPGRWCVSPTLEQASGCGAVGIVDSEALIVVEFTVVTAQCPSNLGEELRIANILFNNLDIIANQETIVELIGFTKRVSAIPQSAPKRIPSESVMRTAGSVKSEDTPDASEASDSEASQGPLVVRTEVTFDFHRLSVLLLRASLQDGELVGRKIATATMTDAKIQATVANSNLELCGSLGGLQVVSLCPGSGVHSRIVSVGLDPLHPLHHTHTLTQEIYSKNTHTTTHALSFRITRSHQDYKSPEAIDVEAKDEIIVGVSIHMASVWYTHSGIFIGELQSCATQFTQYLSNLAKSIRAAATDMAIGLVQPRNDSLYSNPRVSGSMDWSVSSKRARSISIAVPQDYQESTCDLRSASINLKVDVILDTPVIVLPRTPTSPEVFVAHLGNISLTNKNHLTNFYNINIRDINVYSLNVSPHLSKASLPHQTVEEMYSCGREGKPILHDTTLHFTVERIALPCDEAAYGLSPEHCVEIVGRVVTPLVVSSTRRQYEQLLDTMSSLVVAPAGATHCQQHTPTTSTADSIISDSQHHKRQMYAVASSAVPNKFQQVKVHFQLPIFTVELRGDFGEGERSLVDLSFRDFFVNYDKCQPDKTNLEMSLRSITMEDLSREVDSKHRFMMVSHKPSIPKATYVSKSCPNLTCEGEEMMKSSLLLQPPSSSLPDQLHTLTCVTPSTSIRKIEKQPSLAQDNLVLIFVELRDTQHEDFKEKHKNVRKVTKVDFNSLDLVVSLDSWVVVLDFFGMGADEKQNNKKKATANQTKSEPQSDGDVGVCEMEMSVRSLNIVLLRPSKEVCRANISGLEVLTLTGEKEGGKRISGTLQSMSLTDMTSHGRIWRERFLSSGKEALSFQYERFPPEDALLAECDSHLLIEMSSIIYIHTKRFIGEIQSFFREFSRLQAVLSSAHQKVSVSANSSITRLQLSVHCQAPAILVPVSSASSLVLVADLNKLTVSNTFKKSGSSGTVSTLNKLEDAVPVLLDVMTICLDNMDLYCGEKTSEGSGNTILSEEGYLSLGQSSGVARRGPCLLTHKCGLTLQVERNLEDHHNVADMTIQGTLDTLDGAIDLAQYRVIKGLLSNNLGENLDDLFTLPITNTSKMTDTEEHTWTLTSIRLELLNVTLGLETSHTTSTQEGSSLACINFIKSHLLVETFSDMTQDIDLVSQEILVSDTRYKSYPVNKRYNVFSNIVQPMGLKADHNGVHSVQAEVHARKRKEHSAYTILVNNMRLMAIIDWWQAVNEFIMSPPTPATITIHHVPSARISQRETLMHSSTAAHRQSSDNEYNFELKLNITESQVVFVEDTSQWDTNAVILKSTTVISYKPGSEPKPLSCVLNHCEVFSCVLGLEDETALSIIDPVTVQIDLSAGKVLQVQIPQLSVRLSYHDVRMLLKMFQSLPHQTRSGRAAQDNFVLPVNHQGDQEQQASSLPVNLHVEENSLQQLCGMGFSRNEAVWALTTSGNTVDQAALLLAEHSLRTPVKPTTYKHLPLVQHQIPTDDLGQPSFHSVQIKADCISLCVIDDCRDCDVPLVEISLSEMLMVQDTRLSPPSNITSPPLLMATPAVSTPPLPLSDNEVAPGGGKLQCKLTSDYYNRALSGWEPFIEPWRCEANWEYGLSVNLKRNRLQVEVNSTERLNINITSSLVELYGVVKTSWSQDYYAPRASPSGPRRRSPFVPFALLNQTGCKLSFTTLVTTPDMVSESVPTLVPDAGSWTEVPSGETCPFTFGARGKQRHRDSHKLRLHQLAIHIEGWGPIPPVCVDKVGVFFRQATHIASDIEARVVFSVNLEGSARKLVTVRSALQLVNHLPESVEVRADNIAIKSLSAWPSGGSVLRNVFIKNGETWCVPLSHNPTPMWVRPVSTGTACSYLYCAQPLDWRLAARQSPDDTIQLPHCCHSNTQSSYRFICIMKREQFPLERGLPQPGHVLILKPPVRLVNLLPVEINYKMTLPQGQTDVGRVAPGQSAPLSQVDVQKSIEMSIFMEGFPGAGSVVISPTVNTSFSCKLRLSDMAQRKLTLNAYVSIKRSDTIKVSISAPYWIVNRTGVPIVFRQEGVTAETAGQFEEHEIARMVAPLLFSFADSDGSPTVVARVGAGVIPNGQPQWCSPFGLGVGVMVRRLVVGGNGERSLLVGIAVRPGKGRYRHTNICTISPRFQIHNNTSFHLQFAQKCYATVMSDPGAAMTQVSAIPGCSMPFHWPRPDRDQLLCVRILDLPNCSWSGGFRVDMNHSLHINVRDNNAACFFLRLEVVLQGATYFIVFTDADTMPPPIRLDNYSLVPLKFHQVGCKEEYLLKAHSSKPWALVEACGAGALGIKAPGGTGTTIDLHKLDTQKAITYQNFIYIAFTGTHLKPVEAGNGMDVESLQLVLCAWGIGTGGGRVVLGRRREGERAQLWRHSPQGHLLHEGSSPPQPANAPPDISAPHALVLDIEGSAVQPGSMVGLCLRRVNPRRASTQTWNFTLDGRLTCAHRTMCVQPQDGFFGLREGGRAVLGMPGTPGPYILPNNIPIEQAVSSQTLRPGSGFLSVTVETDGPTRVVKIVDSKLKDENWCEGRGAEVGSCAGASGGEIQVRVAIRGVGISIVQKGPPLELVYAHHKGVLLETVWTATTQALNLSVQDMQYDNQLLGTPCPVLLHSTRVRGLASTSTSGGFGSLPILQVSVERNAPSSPRQRAHIFQHLLVTVRPLSLHLEERLLLLLAQWLGLASQSHRQANEDPDEADFEAQKLLSEVTAAHAKRYYFRVFKLQPGQIRLSMQTAGKLPHKLLALKKRLGLTLIKFEDAGVELEPFVRLHPFETSQFLWHSILKHYKDELKWQAAIILGSVDFLGNPLGFVQDVSDGVSGLIYEGNVGALVKNVTHGISNSAAKVTESLGDGLGRVILDEAHEETRARIRGVGTGGEVGPSGHLAAGLRGLGLGILGGMTSLVKHSYEGAQHQGLPGFLAGVGKGLVGTLTKPVVGVLDLAAETAAALRDTSRSERWTPERLRPPRCPLGPGGLLPRYSRSQSVGRQLLYTITQAAHTSMEVFLAYDTIRSHPYDIRALVSTTHLRIFTCTSGEPHIVIESHLSNIVSCQAVSGTTLGEHYIELVVRGESGGGSVRRPQVQCDTGDQARWVTHQLNYAKSMYQETLYTVQEDGLELN